MDDLRTGLDSWFVGFSSVFSREEFAFPGEEISLSFLPEPAAVSVRGWARVVLFLLLGSLVVGVLSSEQDK